MHSANNNAAIHEQAMLPTQLLPVPILAGAFEQPGLITKQFEPAISVDADQLGELHGSGSSQASFFKA